MLKIIGSAAVILSATLFGMMKYNAFYDRKRTLQEILDGARKINSGLAALHAPLHEIFMESGDFYKKAAAEIADGQLPEEAVKSVALQFEALKSEDLKTVERFASGLCASSCEGQLSNLAVFMSELEKNLADATAELNGRGKLFVKGSILSAAAIVLLLI